MNARQLFPGPANLTLRGRTQLRLCRNRLNSNRPRAVQNCFCEIRLFYTEFNSLATASPFMKGFYGHSRNLITGQYLSRVESKKAYHFSFDVTKSFFETPRYDYPIYIPHGDGCKIKAMCEYKKQNFWTCLHFGQLNNLNQANREAAQASCQPPAGRRRYLHWRDTSCSHARLNPSPAATKQPRPLLPSDRLLAAPQSPGRRLRRERRFRGPVRCNRESSGRRRSRRTGG